MNRRAFFRLLAAAPLAACSLTIAAPVTAGAAPPRVMFYGGRRFGKTAFMHARITLTAQQVRESANGARGAFAAAARAEKSAMIRDLARVAQH